MKKDSISKRINIILLVFSVSFLVFFVTMIYIIKLTKVEGEIYNDIISREKLIADILPPPGYISELHLLVTQILFNGIDNYIETKLEDIKRIKYNYRLTLKKWKEEQGDLYKIFSESNFHVNEYFDILETKYIPAIKSGDMNEAAREFYKLNLHFEEHKNAVKQMVEKIKIDRDKKEIRGRKIVDTAIMSLFVMGFSIFTYVLIFIINSGKRINHFNDKIKALMDEKNKFYSIISHDLRGTVGNFYEVMKLLNTNKNISLDRKEEMMQVLQKSAQKSYILLENLLEWTKSQSSTYVAEIRDVSVREIIEHAIYMSEDNAIHKEISIIPEIEDFTIKVDVKMIDTVMRNILANAIKFTSKNGSITVKSQQKDGKEYLSIQDNGIGMSKTRIQELQGKSKPQSMEGTEGEQGSGLGFQICKDFVEKNYGKIYIESKCNQGTSIILEFTLT